MKKNCLTCRHEPDWGEWYKGEYARYYGKCQWPNSEIIDQLPAVYEVNISLVERFKRDNSGLPYNCNAWEEKI
jgi:hypothetical protein